MTHPAVTRALFAIGAAIEAVGVERFTEAFMKVEAFDEHIKQRFARVYRGSLQQIHEGGVACGRSEVFVEVAERANNIAKRYIAANDPETAEAFHKFAAHLMKGAKANEELYGASLKRVIDTLLEEQKAAKKGAGR